MTIRSVTIFNTLMFLALKKINYYATHTFTKQATYITQKYTQSHTLTSISSRNLNSIRDVAGIYTMKYKTAHLY